MFLSPSGFAGSDAGALREAGANRLSVDPAGIVLIADSGSRSIERFDPATKRKTTLARAYDGRRFDSSNDVIRRRDGAIFFPDPPCGRKDRDASPVRELAFNGIYLLDVDGNVQLIDDALSFPNGFAQSPDERTPDMAARCT